MKGIHQSLRPPLSALRVRPVSPFSIHRSPFTLLLAALLCLTLCTTACAADKWKLTRPMEYAGMCDASAAVAVSSNLFIVASDEDNILRLYNSDNAGPPLKEFDFNSFLEVSGKSLETDLEGAARIGDRAFWIGSHGRNRNGKERLNRHRLFATDIRMSAKAAKDVTLTPAGTPYRNLADDLIGDPQFQRFGFAQASQLAPKEPGALNIEGLAATPEGHLLIGFRSPIPEGKALIIPLLNPNEVIEQKPARFGAAIQLDLKGRGIRDFAYFEGEYVIIAGSAGSGGKFQIYRWAGGTSPPKSMKVSGMGGYSPEAIIIYPQLGLSQLQILSDDGTRLIDGVPGKELPASRQRFRSFWVEKEK